MTNTTPTTRINPQVKNISETSLYFIQDMTVFVFLYPYYLADIDNLYKIKHIKQPRD